MSVAVAGQQQQHPGNQGQQQSSGPQQSSAHPTSQEDSGEGQAMDTSPDSSETGHSPLQLNVCN